MSGSCGRRGPRAAPPLLAANTNKGRLQRPSFVVAHHASNSGAGFKRNPTASCMGGTVGARAALIFGNFDGLVVLSPSGFSPYVSPLPVKVLTDITVGTMFGKIPVRILTRTRLGQKYAAGYPLDAKPSTAGIPVLIIQSERDHFVRPGKLDALFSGVLEPKEIVIVPGGEHAGDLLTDETAAVIRGFFRKHTETRDSRADSSRQSTGDIPEMKISGDLPVPEELLKQDLARGFAHPPAAAQSHDHMRARVQRLLEFRGYNLAAVSLADSSPRPAFVIDTPVINNVSLTGNNWMSEDYIKRILALDGGYYNSYELDRAVRKLASEPAVNTVKSNVVVRSDGNVDINLDVLEQKPYRLLLATKFTDIDRYLGMGFTWNEFNPTALRGEGRVMFGLEGHDFLYEIRACKELFRNSLKLSAEYFDVVKSRDDLAYIFTRQEVHETGAGLSAHYDVTAYSSITVGGFEKRYKPPNTRQLFPVESGTADGVSVKLFLAGKLPLHGAPRLRWEYTFYYQKCGVLDYGDFFFETFQSNLTGESVITDNIKARTALHLGWLLDDPPPQELFSLGGMTTLPGYPDDSFVDDQMFLAGQTFYFSARQFVHETSKWAPLRLILAFHAGTVWDGNEKLRPEDLRMDAGFELDYMETLRTGVVWPVGPLRGDSPRIYVGWGIHVF